MMPAAAALTVHIERGAAAARRSRVRIADRESTAGDRVDEIDLGALEVAHADRIHEQPHAVRLEHLIACAAGFLDHQAVLKPRAATALHKYAKTAAGLVLFRQQLVDLRRCSGGHVDHCCCLLTLTKLYAAPNSLSKPVRHRIA